MKFDANVKFDLKIKGQKICEEQALKLLKHARTCDICKPVR